MEDRSDELVTFLLLCWILAMLEAVFGAHRRIDDLEDVVNGG